MNNFTVEIYPRHWTSGDTTYAPMHELTKHNMTRQEAEAYADTVCDGHPCWVPAIYEEEE